MHLASDFAGAFSVTVVLSTVANANTIAYGVVTTTDIAISAHDWQDKVDLAAR